MRSRGIRWAGVFLAAWAWLVLAPGTAHAGGVVGDGTPASCTDAALTTAVAGGGTVTFNCGASPVTIAATTKVVNQGEVTVVDGGGKVTLDGENNLQLFLVLTGGNLTLRNITLNRGNFSVGGAIFNATGGTLALRSVVIDNSRAEGGGNDGGAIQNRGTLTVELSSFNGNNAADGGGAIYNDGGTATIRYTNFSNNTAGSGGALYNDGGTMTLFAVLLRRNTATAQGGGLYAAGNVVNMTSSLATDNLAADGGGLYATGTTTVTLLNATVYRNRADTAGGLWNNTTSFSLKNSIVADNLLGDGVTDGFDCDGPSVTTLGHNIISDGTCIIAAAEGDRRNTDPQLGSLQANGGPTFSVLPLPGSPAIDGGANAGCPPFDQRGFIRPLGAACDVGATELGVELFLEDIRR